MDTRVEVTVEVGSWVVLRTRERHDVRDESWRIVEHADANPFERRLSVLSPLAKVPMGQRRGDKVELRVLTAAWPIEILHVTTNQEEPPDGDLV